MFGFLLNEFVDYRFIVAFYHINNLILVFIKCFRQFIIFIISNTDTIYYLIIAKHYPRFNVYFAIYMSTTTTMLQLMLKMQKRSSDDEFSKQEKVKVLEKVKGTCIYYLYCAPFWYFIHAYNIYDTHKVYTFTLFSFFLCFLFSYIIQASNFFRRPVLECTTNFIV